MPDNKYFTLKELSQMSNTPYATIKRDIDGDLLPAYKVGRKYFIAEYDALNYSHKRKELYNIDGYTIKEIMEIIPLSYAYIIDLIRQKKLKAVKVGRNYIVEKKELTRFISETKLKGR